MNPSYTQNILNRLKEWLESLLNEFNASYISMLDERGLVILEASNKENIPKNLMKYIGSFSIALSSYIARSLNDSVSYILIETRNNIIIIYGLIYSGRRYHLMILLNKDIPIGMVLFRLDNLVHEIDRLLKTYEYHKVSEESRIKIDEIEDFENLLRKVESHPLYKLLMRSVKSNKSRENILEKE